MEYYAKFDDATIKQLVDAMNTGINTERITINQNGTYVAPVGKGYTPVVVDVQGGGLGLKKYTATVKVYSSGSNNDWVIDRFRTSIKFFANTNSKDIVVSVPLTNGVGEVEIYGDNNKAYLGERTGVYPVSENDLEYFPGIDESDAKWDNDVGCYYIDKNNAVISFYLDNVPN